MSELLEWLRARGLEAIGSILVDNDIALDIRLDLTDQDLERLGLSPGQRRRLLRATIRFGAHRSAAPSHLPTSFLTTCRTVRCAGSSTYPETEKACKSRDWRALAWRPATTNPAYPTAPSGVSARPPRAEAFQSFVEVLIGRPQSLKVGRGVAQDAAFGEEPAEGVLAYGRSHRRAG